MYTELIDINKSYIRSKVVVMPKTWRSEIPIHFTFALFEEELSREELRNFFNVSNKLNLPNPRPISKRFLELASLFHPLLFHNFYKEERGSGQTNSSFTLSPLTFNKKSESSLEPRRFYLQSLLFLAGCTLSAAIIQNRFSSGTIYSKLDHLWLASEYAERFEYAGIDIIDLKKYIYRVASEPSPSYGQLIELKKNYGKVLSSIYENTAASISVIKEEQLSPNEKKRFGFIDQLKKELGNNLTCVFVYGSSVTSEAFSDYDLILVVKNSDKALEQLAGKHPSYKGFEMNISIYDENEFLVFQTLSGDNLNQNAKCLYGECSLPIKPRNDLLLRNFSFGFIRMRQLLGMAAFLSREGTHFGLENKSSLYQYFIKIPMHIMKGVRAVAGEQINKEYINEWIKHELNYDINEQITLCEVGQPWQAIVNAYWATSQILLHLNKCYNIFNPETEELINKEEL